MRLGRRTMLDHCDRLFTHFPIPPASSRQWGVSLPQNFLRQYLLSSAPPRLRNSSSDRDRGGIATARLQRPGDKLASERGSPAARSVPVRPGCISSSAEGARISDMVRPCIRAGRDSSACRLVGRSHSPCRSIKATLFALSSVKAGAVLPENVRRSEEHTSELQSRQYLVCRLLPD